MTRVAIAGSTGFIGRAAARALAMRGHQVSSVPRDAATAGAADVLVWAAGRRELDDAANLAVHAEAPVQVARALQVSRIVYLSSGECYGDAPLPYREDGPVLGTSSYARAKRAGERAVAQLVPSTVLRLGVVYGPGQSPRMMIPQLVAALRVGHRFPLTEGTQTRDFVYIDDVAEAIVAAVASPPVPVVNIASGIELAVRDACARIARALGAAPELLGFGEVAMRPDEARRYVLDVSLAREAIGWRPRTPFDVGAAQL